MGLRDDYRDALRHQRVIRLIGSSNNDMVKEFYKSLDELLKKSDIENKKVFVGISSGGGNVMNAFIIHQELRSLDGIVDLHTLGLGGVASSAAYLLLSVPVERRVATRTSRFYFHPHTYCKELKQDADVIEHDRQMREYAAELEEVKAGEELGINLISSATGQSQDSIRELRSKVSGFGVEEALVLGLIGHIME